MNEHIWLTRATAADVDSLLDVERECFAAEAFSRRQIAYLVSRSKGVFYVAKDDKDAIAGYVSVLVNSYTANARIYSIAVAPSHRGLGIAGVLVGHVIDYCLLNGLKAIFLEVRVDNYTAISLYEKSGFVKNSLKRGYYEDGTDAYGMVLQLSE